MSEKLTPAALTALSVSKIESEMQSGAYTNAELVEAVALENVKEEPRKTAIEAFEAAMTADDTGAPQTAAGHCVAEGKAITTKAGIKTAGDEVTAAILNGGEATLKTLIRKGYVTE